MQETILKWKSIFLAALLGLTFAACGTKDSLNVGDKAPDFNLPSTEESNVSSSDYLGKKPVLLYFHMAVG